MRLSFSVDKITSEFIESFQNADGPPIMEDYDGYDPTEPAGILIDLIESSRPDGVVHALAARWTFNGPPFVAANENGSSVCGGDWLPVDQFTMSDLIAMVYAAEMAGNADIEIEYSGTPSDEVLAIRSDWKRLQELATATEQEIEKHKDSEEQNREDQTHR